MTNRSSLKIALLAGIVGLALAPAANAQDYGSAPGYRNAPPQEEVPVTAPRFRTDQTRLNGPLEAVSLSTNVRYDDLDLQTRQGAHALRMRVRDAARDVCAQLAGVYPVYQANGTSCYRTAMQNALLRADRAIGDAREYRP